MVLKLFLTSVNLPYSSKHGEPLAFLLFEVTYSESSHLRSVELPSAYEKITLTVPGRNNSLCLFFIVFYAGCLSVACVSSSRLPLGPILLMAVETDSRSEK